MYLILSESDRERLGCPEKLPVKLADITAREQATLQNAFRYHDTTAMAEAMQALLERDDKGEVVRVRGNPELSLALAWLGLRRAGVFTARGRVEMAAELDGLDIEVNKFTTEADEEELAAAQEADEVAEGKEESSTLTRTSTD